MLCFSFAPGSHKKIPESTWDRWVSSPAPVLFTIGPWSASEGRQKGMPGFACLTHCQSTVTNSILFYRNSHGKSVRPKGNQPWIFVGRTDAEAEAPILWPPDGKSRLIGRDSDAGKDWKQEENRGDRRWDGWMAPPTQWTWIWASSERQWRTRKPGVLLSMGSQREMIN